MGGLFSSEPPQRSYEVGTWYHRFKEDDRLRAAQFARQQERARYSPSSSSSSSYEYNRVQRTIQSTPTYQRAQNHNEVDRLTRQLVNLTLSPPRPKTPDVLVQRKPFLLDSLLYQVPALPLTIMESFNATEDIEFVPLTQNTAEYNTVARAFRTTNKRCFKITGIAKVENKYLYTSFALKLKQLNAQQCHVKNLFHGTKHDNVDGICDDNFNWRLHGLSKGNKFGKGVSFSNNSYYATHYGNKKLRDKVMIMAKVYVNRVHVGNAHQEVPLTNYDATTSQTNKVIVKYDDFSYYPAYIIYYSGFDYGQYKQY